MMDGFMQCRPDATTAPATGMSALADARRMHADVQKQDTATTADAGASQQQQLLAAEEETEAECKRWAAGLEDATALQAKAGKPKF